MNQEEDDYRDIKARVLKPRRPGLLETPVDKREKTDRQAEILDMAKGLGEQIAKALAAHGPSDINVNNEINTPTAWELTVTERDGDRRIRKMTIKAAK